MLFGRLGGSDAGGRRQGTSEEWEAAAENGPVGRPYDRGPPHTHAANVRADAPPLILTTGGRAIEMLGRYEENAYLARMMKIAGHTKTVLYEFPECDHGSMATPADAVLLEYLRKAGDADAGMDASVPAVKK